MIGTKQPPSSGSSLSLVIPFLLQRSGNVTHLEDEWDTDMWLGNPVVRVGPLIGISHYAEGNQRGMGWEGPLSLECNSQLKGVT